MVIRAATEPAAGIGPSSDGPVTSGLVTINLDPLPINLTALVRASKLRFLVSPKTTKSGFTSVMT